MSTGTCPNEKEWSLLKALLGDVKPSWTKMANDNTLPAGMTAAQARVLWFHVRRKFMDTDKVVRESSTSPRKSTNTLSSPAKRARTKVILSEHEEEDE